MGELRSIRCTHDDKVLFLRDLRLELASSLARSIGRMISWSQFSGSRDQWRRHSHALCLMFFKLLTRLIMVVAADPTAHPAGLGRTEEVCPRFRQSKRVGRRNPQTK